MRKEFQTFEHRGNPSLVEIHHHKNGNITVVGKGYFSRREPWISNNKYKATRYSERRSRTYLALLARQAMPKYRYGGSVPDVRSMVF